MKRPDKEEMKPRSTKEPLDCAIWYSQYARELEKYADYLEGLVKNSRLGGVSESPRTNPNQTIAPIEEDTEFCPHCNSPDIYCEGGEFNEWDCENCGQYFSEPNVK